MSFIIPGNPAVDPEGVALKELIPGTLAIFRELQAFRERYTRTLPPGALAALANFFETATPMFSAENMNSSAGHRALHFRVTALVALEAEISYHLTDFRARAKRLSERAFAHLQRSIVADPDCAKRWLLAFTEKGETACERLGGVHLLWHGIWAFKAHSEAERTDLIMGDAIGEDHIHRIEDVAEALVLTEWKKVAEPSELKKCRDAALKQAKLYAAGSLLGIELDAYCYLVLVTERALKMLDDFEEAGVQYRHINIAVAPLNPSRAARSGGSPSSSSS